LHGGLGAGIAAASRGRRREELRAREEKSFILSALWYCCYTGGVEETDGITSSKEVHPKHHDTQRHAAL